VLKQRSSDHDKSVRELLISARQIMLESALKD
jgi:hypothetical protein